MMQCAECKSVFANAGNLRRHVRQFHRSKEAELAPLIYKTSENYKFRCYVCQKNFNKQKHFSYHLKNAHKIVSSLSAAAASEISEPEKIPSKKKCSMCHYHDSHKPNLIKHFQEVHEIVINETDIELPIESFQGWKEELELRTKAKFVLEYSRTLKNKITKSYICHRSGNYLPEGKGQRHLKTKGSCKMNAFCPAAIKVRHEQSSEKCHIHFMESHVGHNTDLGHLTLTQTQRKNLAQKIADKIPFEQILDEIRDSASDCNLQRLHLLTKKDLYNLESSFNLGSLAVRHSNDASVEAWVNEVKKISDCVLYYKPQNETSMDHPNLKSEDFLLIIMNNAQSEMLKKYGPDFICVDGTHGLNKDDFKLQTLLVLDNIRQGFLCAFLISNRSDAEVLSIFFHYIKLSVGHNISARVFMSDMAEQYYTAWSEIMGAAQMRLYCTWHVDSAWRKNLSKITDKENQVQVYKELQTLMQETDLTAFKIMLEEFYRKLDSCPETSDFASYFLANYMSNFESWANCYRANAGINTNMHLERLHKTIKYVYLNGKKVKRLDKSIQALMSLARDKLFDRLVVINKGKIEKKLSDIRNRHKRSLNLDLNTIISSEGGWDITSSASSSDMYHIREVNCTCTCQLICTECDECMHRYSCSCIDSTIKWNMCKHVHLLCNWRRVQGDSTNPVVESTSHKDADEEADIDLNLDLPPFEEESIVITEEVSKKNDSQAMLDFRKKKEKITERFLATMNNITSPSQLEIVERLIAPMSPTLAAANNKGQLPCAGKKQTSKQKIKSRDYSPPKKKRRPSERLLQNPINDEFTAIAFSYSVL